MDGKVVTHFGVYGLTVRVGSARVAAAGVNLVVTHPDYRKQGLMPKTIWSSIEAMRDRGYDISIVANAVENYYERFGCARPGPKPTTISRPKACPTRNRACVCANGIRALAPYLPTSTMPKTAS